MRRKIVACLTYCIDSGTNDDADCRRCPYYVSSARLACWINLLIDARELLEDEEPVEPKYNEAESWDEDWYSCGSCGLTIGRETKYCPECGKKVQWQ